MADVITFLRLGRDICKLVLEIGQLIKGGDSDEAINVIQQYEAGRAAWLASHAVSSKRGAK